jgi:hypothetical protein
MSFYYIIMTDTNLWIVITYISILYVMVRIVEHHIISLQYHPYITQYNYNNITTIMEHISTNRNVVFEKLKEYLISRNNLFHFNTFLYYYTKPFVKTSMSIDDTVNKIIVKIKYDNMIRNSNDCTFFEEQYINIKPYLYDMIEKNMYIKKIVDIIKKNNDTELLNEIKQYLKNIKDLIN